MNRRHTDRMPSPFFRAVIYTLAILVVLLASIFSNIASAADLARAPVVVPSKTNAGVMVQTGWYTYERLEDAVVLYCVQTTDVTLACALFVTTAEGNAVVLIEGVVASEVKS